MANSFDILVKGDFKQVTKGFVDLSKKFEDISKKSVGFKLDKDSEAFFKDGGNKILGKLKNNLAEAKLGMKEMAKTAGHSAFDFKNFQEAAEHVSNLTNEINNVQKSLGNLEKSRGSRIISSLVDKMGGGSGSGDMTTAVVSGGLISTVIKWAGKKLADASINEIYKGLDRFDAQSSDRIRLMGFGIGKTQQASAITAGRGGLYSPIETLKQMGALAQLTGTADGLSDIQRHSRAFGLDPSQLIGQSGELRQMGFSGREVQKQLASQIGEAVASKLERSRIGEFLEQVSSYTSTLAQNGAVDPTAIAEAVRQVMDVSGGGFYGQPGGAISGLNSIDSYIKNSAKGGMGLGATSSVFSQMYPGASANELILKMSQGLFGPSDAELDAQLKSGALLPGQDKMFRGKTPLATFKAMFDQFDKNTQGLEGAGKANYIASQLGLSPNRALTLDNIIHSNKPQDIQEADLKKFLDSQTNEAMTPIEKSTEGIHADTTIIREIMLTQFGQGFAPIRNQLMKAANATEGATYGKVVSLLSSGSNGVGENSQDTGNGLYSIPSSINGIKIKNSGFRDQNGLLTNRSAISSDGIHYKTDDIRDRFAGYAQSAPGLMAAVSNAPSVLGMPQTITSSLRSEYENERAGGVANSAHLSGQAVDLRTNDKTPEEIASMAQYFKSLGFKVVDEGDHLHVQGQGDQAALTSAIKELTDTIKTKSSENKVHKIDSIKQIPVGLQWSMPRLITGGDER